MSMLVRKCMPAHLFPAFLYYVAACNAMGNFLVHQNLAKDGRLTLSCRCGQVSLNLQSEEL